MTGLPTSEIHLSRVRPVTREDGCTLYQCRDGCPAAVWIAEGSHPDPRNFRVVYAADWPEGPAGRHAAEVTDG